MRDETAEWITQAEYDIDTAQAMFEQYPSSIAEKYLENAREMVKCLKLQVS